MPDLLLRYAVPSVYYPRTISVQFSKCGSVVGSGSCQVVGAPVTPELVAVSWLAHWQDSNSKPAFGALSESVRVASRLCT
jgi:hypothetical protein